MVRICFAFRERLMNRPHCFLMRSLFTAHFQVHNKFPVFFNKMFIINISVVRPTRKGRQDYLADVASDKGTEAQQPLSFIRRLLTKWICNVINCAPTPREFLYKYRTIFVHSPHFSIRNTFVTIFWKVPVKQSSVFSSSGIKFKVSAIHNGSSERTQMSPNPFKHAYFLLELNTGKRKWRKKRKEKKQKPNTLLIVLLS